MGGSETHAFVTADAGGQDALLKKPLKYRESLVFSGRRKFTSEQEMTGVIGDRERIAPNLRSLTLRPVFRNGRILPSELDEAIIRIRRNGNPNWPELIARMNDGGRTLFPRFAAQLVTTALKDTPVVMIAGPRQSGKTTLVRDLIGTIVS